MARPYSIDDIAKYKAQSGGRLSGQYFTAMRTYFHYTVISLRVSKFRMDAYTLNEGEEDERPIQVTIVVFEIVLADSSGVPAIVKLLYKDQGFLQFRTINDQMTRVDFKQIPNIYQQRIDFETFLKRNFPRRMWTSDTMDQDKQYVTNRLQEFGLLDAELQEYIGLSSNKFGILPPGATSFSRGNGYEGSGYGDWIANLQAIQSGNGFVSGVPTPEYYIGDVPPQEGEGYYEWQSNLAKLSGGAYESVLADHGNKIIERLFLMKAHNLYLIEIITNSNNIGLYFDDKPTLFVEARSVNNSNNSQNKIEIPLKSKPLTLRKFMTKHSKPDDRFRNSYEYMFDRLFSNDLISNSDISDFLALPQPYYEGYDPNPEPSELLRPD
jgi:hypothetical protein